MDHEQKNYCFCYFWFIPKQWFYYLIFTSPYKDEKL